jgi:hypothetical protein
MAPPVSVVLVQSGRSATHAATSAGELLIAPTRPGAVLDEARRRRLA